MTAGSTTYYPEQKMFHGNLARVMGTRFDAVVIGMNEADSIDVWEECVNRLDAINRVADRFDSRSEVWKINNAEPVSRVYVSDELQKMLTLAKRHAAATGGVFDVTLGKGSHFEIDTDGALVIPNNGLAIDFGGFAKGYALREIRDVLRRRGVERAFVDFGNSSILAIGTHPFGNCWEVSVTDPFTAKEVKRVALKDTSMSTSGNTPVYNTHIVNPETGAWITGKIMSVIVADDPLDAEVLSTTWMIADAEKRKSILHNYSVREEFVYIG